MILSLRGAIPVLPRRLSSTSLSFQAIVAIDVYCDRLDESEAPKYVERREL